MMHPSYESVFTPPQIETQIKSGVSAGANRRLPLELVFDDEADPFGDEFLETVRTPIFARLRCRDPDALSSTRYIGLPGNSVVINSGVLCVK